MSRSNINYAGDFLAHFLPKRVLVELRELASAQQREEIIRVYIARRMWFVIPIGFLFFFSSAACAVASRLLLLRLFTPPIEGWVQWATVILGVLVLLGGTMVQLHLLFSWLGKQALRATASVPDSILDHWSSRRNGNEIFLLSLCIVVSLAVLSAAFPPLAALLAVLVMLAPIIYTMFYG